MFEEKQKESSLIKILKFVTQSVIRAVTACFGALSVIALTVVIGGPETALSTSNIRFMVVFIVILSTIQTAIFCFIKHCVKNIDSNTAVQTECMFKTTWNFINNSISKLRLAALVFITFLSFISMFMHVMSPEGLNKTVVVFGAISTDCFNLIAILLGIATIFHQICQAIFSFYKVYLAKKEREMSYGDFGQ